MRARGKEYFIYVIISCLLTIGLFTTLPTKASASEHRINLHVIAIDSAPNVASKLEAISRAGDGTFTQADSTAELISAVKQTGGLGKINWPIATIIITLTIMVIANALLAIQLIKRRRGNIEIVEPKVPDAFVVIHGQSHHIGKSPWLIGRSRDTDFRLTDSSVSRYHLKIEIHNKRWVIQDLGSRNKTYLNGVRLQKRSYIGNGDILLIGQIKATFRC